MTGTFAEWAPIYRCLGYWPRPIAPGKKGCFLSEWQRPDTEISPDELDGWLTKYANHGIGLLTGSPFEDGTCLGFLDVDNDDYVRIAQALLGDPVCGRFGSKGIAYPVRVKGQIVNPKFKLKLGSKSNLVTECLFEKTLCVLPPSIHPDTKKPYHWVGQPLHEINYQQLPVIGE